MNVCVRNANKNLLYKVGWLFKCPSSCNWNKEWADLKEHLVNLVCYIKRRTCGIASAGLPLFSV